jgi:hypothetical protein
MEIKKAFRVAEVLMKSLFLFLFITLFVCGSSHSSAASASANAAAVDKDGDVAMADRYDAEIDTKNFKEQDIEFLRVPPKDTDLKEAFERAQKQQTPLTILGELCKPYAQHDPDLFGFDVYERWRKICEEKGLLEKGAHGKACFKSEKLIDEIHVYVQTITREQKEITGIFLGCLGLRDAHDYQEEPCLKIWRFEGAYKIAFQENQAQAGVAIRRLNWLWGYTRPYNLDAINPESAARRYSDVEFANKIRKQEIGWHSERCKAIERVTPLLPEICSLIGLYFWPSKMMADVIRDGIQQSDFSQMMVEDLAGVKAATSYPPHRSTSQALVVLDLSKNIISKVRSCAFGLGGCNQILLADNRIRIIEPLAFQGQLSLQYLDLSRNLLPVIRAGVFDSLPYLRRLIIDHAQVRHIEPGTLVSLGELVKLSLRGNYFTRMPQDIEPLLEQGKLRYILINDEVDETQDEQEAKRVACIRALELRKHQAFSEKAGFGEDAPFGIEENG